MPTITFSPTAQNHSPVKYLHQYPPQLQQLIHQLQENPYLSPAQTKTAVEQANLSATDLMPWASFDHPATDSYGRQLVFHGGYFEIMVMSWLPGDFSAIHDHGSTQWGAVQSFGQADHFIYQLEGDRLSSPESAPYKPGMVRAVDNDLIHQMGNKSASPFLSLHVYGCANASNSITGNARVFNLFENSIQYTDGGVFFALTEDLINDRHCGLTAETDTALIHHYLMRDRLQHILDNAAIAPQLEPQRTQYLRQKLTALQAAIQTLQLSAASRTSIANRFS